jgi:hypothetical protein
MPALRYLLIVVTSLSLAAIALTGIAEGSRLSGLEVLILLSVGGVLFANFMYLLGVSPTGQPTKPASLFRLWLTAKENELKRRATGPAGSPHSGASAASRDRN